MATIENIPMTDVVKAKVLEFDEVTGSFSLPPTTPSEMLVCATTRVVLLGPARRLAKSS